MMSEDENIILKKLKLSPDVLEGLKRCKQAQELATQAFLEKKIGS
ncbi:MAG: hypothetical protein ACXAC8_16725 [Candidatus Hodarchaeales archaeon]|jgi:hypothetical protein